jgi:protein ImuB
MIVKAVSVAAHAKGIHPEMVVADCRAILPTLEVFDNEPDLPERLLTALAEWCLRYTPVAAVDLPDGLILDVTGCAHLWDGERSYLQNITTRLKKYGYTVRASIADTIGAAWAISRYEKNSLISDSGQQSTSLLSLPPSSLRLEAETVERLLKLGLRTVRDFISIPRTALRRRFGQTLIQRLDQALGHEEEVIQPVQPVEPYHERLQCLEPIITATGIEIALQRLLEALCHHLQQEGKGLRRAVFKGYRVDGKIVQIEIGTNRPSNNAHHLFKLFEIKLSTIEPDLGIELFALQAP